MATIKTLQIKDVDTRFDLAVSALCRKFGYQATVSNPAFDPAKPVDPTANPQTVPNPVTADDFAALCIVNWVKSIVEEFANLQGMSAQQAAVAALIGPLRQLPDTTTAVETTTVP